jgi:NAD(P)-dependent dehydrogenase (short-subunit alcohol dehydrogenase family)
MNEQRVAVVTGASSGIGAEIAARLAGAGFRVFGASRSAPDQADADAGVEHVVIERYKLPTIFRVAMPSPSTVKVNTSLSYC